MVGDVVRRNDRQGSRWGVEVGGEYVVARLSKNARWLGIEGVTLDAGVVDFAPSAFDLVSRAKPEIKVERHDDETVIADGYIYAPRLDAKTVRQWADEFSEKAARHAAVADFLEAEEREKNAERDAEIKKIAKVVRAHGFYPNVAPFALYDAGLRVVEK